MGLSLLLLTKSLIYLKGFLHLFNLFQYELNTFSVNGLESKFFDVNGIFIELILLGKLDASGGGRRSLQIESESSELLVRVSGHVLDAGNMDWKQLPVYGH